MENANTPQVSQFCTRYQRDFRICSNRNQKNPSFWVKLYLKKKIKPGKNLVFNNLYRVLIEYNYVFSI